jgi:hypothetical protein
MCMTGDKLSCFDAGSPPCSNDMPLVEQTAGQRASFASARFRAKVVMPNQSRALSDHIDSSCHLTSVNLELPAA